MCFMCAAALAVKYSYTHKDFSSHRRPLASLTDCAVSIYPLVGFCFAFAPSLQVSDLCLLLCCSVAAVVQPVLSHLLCPICVLVRLCRHVRISVLRFYLSVCPFCVG